MRAYTANIATPAELDARIALSVRADNRPFDLTGAAVTLEIWDARSDDVLLYSASELDAVITVGEQIAVVIQPDTAVYADLQAGYKYRYGLTVVHPALDFRVQGAWQLLRKYGPTQAGPNEWTLSVNDQTITINGGTGPQGERGPPGPAGEGIWKQQVSFTAEDFSGGSIVIGTPPVSSIITDIKIVVSEGFDTEIKVGYATDPAALLLLQAGRTGDLRWRPLVSPIGSIFLSTSVPPAQGSGEIVILTL